MRRSNAKFGDKIENFCGSQIEARDKCHERLAPDCVSYDTAEHSEDLRTLEVSSAGIHLRRISHVRLQHCGAYGDLLGELQTTQINHKLDSTRCPVTLFAKIVLPENRQTFLKRQLMPICNSDTISPNLV